MTGVLTNPVHLVAGSAGTSVQSGTIPGTDADNILRYVDASTIHIAKAQHIAVPSWAKQVLASDQGPLIFAGQTAGQKAAVVTFDLKDSDLPVQTAFPLLIRNLVTYLLPAPAGGLAEAVEPQTTVR